MSAIDGEIWAINIGYLDHQSSIISDEPLFGASLFGERSELVRAFAAQTAR